MLAALRARLHDQLDPEFAEEGSLSVLNRAVVVAILLSVALAVLESEPYVLAGREALFGGLSAALAIFFLVEYAVRVWSCVESPAYAAPIRGRLRYMASWPALLDLIAIVPVLAGLVGIESFTLRLLRVLRILRLARLGAFSTAIVTLAEAVSDRRFELAVCGLLTLTALLISATLLHAVEGEVQPEAFGSVPRAMWWAVATLTTVGYGDAVPVTSVGKLIGGATALIGIALIALPSGILAAAFSDAMQRRRERERRRETARRRPRSDEPP